MPLSKKEIKHLSDLLSSTNDNNTKIAFELLESHPVPKALLSEIFVIYKLEGKALLRKKAANALRRYPHVQISFLLNSNLQLGDRGGLTPTEQTIKRNIERYVNMSRGLLDGLVIGKMMYQKYQVGLKYLLDNLPAEERHALLHSFIEGTKFKLHHGALTTFPIDLYQWKNLTEIDLSHNKIKTIPSRIREFKQLESLNVAHNSIHNISQEIKELSHLKHLDISNNKFKSFPAVVSELQQLESLNIARLNHLLLGEYIEIPKSFQQLTNLQKLRLSDSYTGYSQGLPVNYHNFPNFKSLESIPNQTLNLDPIHLAQLAQEQNGGSEGLLYLFANSKDRVLLRRLIEEQFYHEDTQLLDLKSTMLLKLPAILEEYSIKELNLKGCYLGIEHYSIGKRNLRRHWSLSDQAAIDNIFQSLEKQSSITKADLSRNRLQYLPKALFDWTRVYHLDLSHNVLKILPNQIKTLQQVEFLDLQHNHLKELPVGLGELKQLRWLNLSRNNLTEVPAILGELDALEELYFINTMQHPLLSNHLVDLPDAWKGMRSLKSIHFYDDGLRQEETAKAYEKRLRQLLPKGCTIHLSYD